MLMSPSKGKRHTNLRNRLTLAESIIKFDNSKLENTVWAWSSVRAAMISWSPGMATSPCASQVTISTADVDAPDHLRACLKKYQAASRLSIKRVIATYTKVSLVVGNSS